MLPTRNCERFLNVQTSKQRGKNCQLVGAPGGRGPLQWYNGTMVNPALIICRLPLYALYPLGVLVSAGYTARIDAFLKRSNKRVLVRTLLLYM